MRSKEIEELKSHLKLSKDQRETLIGLLLGDGCLETQNEGRSFRLKIEQSLAHEPYVKHLALMFEGWIHSPPRHKKTKWKGGEGVNVAFSTVSHPGLRFYGHQFYADGRKRVPKLIHKWLTARSLAYWYMDDGSIKSKESKGLILNTQAFTNAEVENLIRALGTNFGLKASPRRQKEGQQIYISGEAYERFIELVDHYFIDEMRYKLPPPRRT